MKKSLLFTILTFFAVNFFKAQCVGTCSNYITYTVPYAPYPSAGINVFSQFIPNTDDGYTPPINIGFNFNYYCTTYSTVLIYTNGLIQFDIGAPSTFPLGYDQATPMPSVTVPNGIVCFRMDDLDPTQGGAVTYTTLGATPNQTFVVTYSNVPLFNPSSGTFHSGQIVLYEGTDLIDIITISSPSHITNLATQGIENASGTVGTPVLTREMSNWGATGSTYRFQGVSPMPPSAISGTASTCSGIANTYSVNPVTGATYNWSLPTGWAGTSSLSTITATAGASGNMSVSATYTCGTSVAVPFSVTTIPAPVVGITSATPNIFCSGQTVTFNVTGASTYTLEPGTIMGVPPLFDTPLTTTTYSLYGINLSGCRSTNNAVVNITVKETPTVTVNSGSVCIGGSFTLTPSGANTYAYPSSIFASFSPTPVGIQSYSVIGTGTNGCVGQPAVSTVTVYALPNINLGSTRPTICIKETTTLTASGGVTYAWSHTTTTTAGVAVHPITNTDYTVTGIDAKGCANTQTFSIKVIPCTGIAENEGGLSFIVFPNPSTGNYTLKSGKDLDIVIYDVVGKIVHEAKIYAGENSLNLSFLPAGTYMLKATGDSETRNLVLLKE